MSIRTALLSASLCLTLAACNRAPPPTLPPPPVPASPVVISPLVDDLQNRAFHYFWDNAKWDTGMIPDRMPHTEPFASIAAMGFGLTAYAIGAERGWITREQARDHTLTMLRFLKDAPQGPDPENQAGYHGFFYHFLGLGNGRRYARWVEVSSVDTSLLLGGVLFAQTYYDRDNAEEAEIRALSEQLYEAVDWPWLQQHAPLISMGWVPEDGVIKHDWGGFNEGMLIYVLALASPTHPVEPDAWQAWMQTYERSWGDFGGQTYLSFAPLFGHQYSHVWIDFRKIRDDFGRKHDMDYFENSRRATYAQRQYAIENPMRWVGYGSNVWGITASDGPALGTQVYNLQARDFRHYSARGAGRADGFDDGTIAPTAAVSSIAFAPEIVIPAITAMHDLYGRSIYGEYGFVDAFNPSFRWDVEVKTGKVVPDVGWVDNNVIGIDQGPMVAIIENYRNEFVRKVMRKTPHIRRGLDRAGYQGG